MLINNDLPGLFDSAPYATAFLAYLIDTFKATGFKIQVQELIKQASSDYIDDNTGIEDFIAEAFDRTNYEHDTVELIKAFDICKLLKYKESLGINVPRDLSSKMKMKGIKTRRGPKDQGDAPCLRI
jgi:hypothetical protein